MKKAITVLMCMILLFSSLVFNAGAENNEEFTPYVIDFVVTTDLSNAENVDAETRATGLIHSYYLSLSKSGTTLILSGETVGTSEVVRTGFKNLVVERRKTSSDSWKEYYDYGNIYYDTILTNLSTTLAVESGYQYRISCKHYAKKSLLVTQTVSNTSNIVTV